MVRRRGSLSSQIIEEFSAAEREKTQRQFSVEQILRQMELSEQKETTRATEAQQRLKLEEKEIERLIDSASLNRLREENKAASQKAKQQATRQKELRSFSLTQLKQLVPALTDPNFQPERRNERLAAFEQLLALLGPEEQAVFRARIKQPIAEPEGPGFLDRIGQFFAGTPELSMAQPRAEFGAAQLGQQDIADPKFLSKQPQIGGERGFAEAALNASALLGSDLGQTPSPRPTGKLQQDIEAIKSQLSALPPDVQIEFLRQAVSANILSLEQANQLALEIGLGGN